MRRFSDAQLRDLLTIALAVCILSGCHSSRNPFQGAYKIGRVSEGMRTMEFSPDGSLAAVPSGDQISICSPAPGYEAWRLEGAKRGGDAFSFAPDAAFLVTGHNPHQDLNCELIVWDLAARKQRTLRVVEQGVNSVSVSSDGSRLVVGCQNGAVQIFSMPDLHPLSVMETSSSWIPALRFLPGTRRFITLGNDGVLNLWDADSGKQLAARTISGATTLAVSLKMIAVAGDGGRLIDPGTLQDLRPVFGIDATVAAFSPDGNEVAFGFSGPGVRLYATKDGTKLETLSAYFNVIDLSARPVAIAYINNGNSLLLAVNNGNVYEFSRE